MGDVAELLGRADDVQFQSAQLAVGDDQEVAAAAGRVQESEGAQLILEGEQSVLVVSDGLELGAEFVEEQGADELEDVLFAGVVGAQLAPPVAGVQFDDLLEHGAEDGGRDGRPVDAATGDELLPHVAVEIGDAQVLLEQPAVDVGKAGQIFVQRFLAL